MIYYRKTLFGCGPKLTAVHAYKHGIAEVKAMLKELNQMLREEKKLMD